MKKIGLIGLALVMALGMLGAVYAMWSEELTVDTTINTGVVCMEMSSPGEVLPVPPCDWNWADWDVSSTAWSCPPGHKFRDATITAACKDIGIVDSMTLSDADGDGHNDTLTVVITDGYPYYLAELSFQLGNCGTIPVIIGLPTITQDFGLYVEYRDHIGWQFEPGEYHEVSLYVGVRQEAPQDTPLTFSITYSAEQWNEAAPQP